MTVKDSPDSRIKARDAKTLLALQPGLETWNHLHTLTNAHGLKAAGCIVMNKGADPLIDTAAHVEEDRLVLSEYLIGYCQHLPYDDVKALRASMILAVRDDGVIDTATWGIDFQACEDMAEFRDMMMEELPAAPFQTWFGWGNEGRPKKLSAEELKMLGDRGREFVERNTHRRASEA